MLYSFLGAAIDNASWGFLTGGTIAEQVVLAAVPEFLIIIILSIAGVMTRNLSKEIAAFRSGRTSGQPRGNALELRK